MGEVYEVFREGTGQRYALKCLRSELVRNPVVFQRALHEAAALRDLRHPNVVAVHATGVRSDGVIWMTMDLLTGFTLRQILADLGRVPVPWATRIVRDAARGLTAVHAFAVHRDLKPENVHLALDGTVRVLDLGAGKFHHLGLTTTGPKSIGTVPYMSPEQIRSPGAIDPRSDLFSAGVILYELLSGKHPFAPEGVDHANVYQLVIAIVAQPIPSLRSAAPWVPAPVAAVVDRCLSVDPAQRFRSAADLADALEAALAELEAAVGPTPPLTTLTEALHRLRGVRNDDITGEESTVLDGVESQRG
jgi:serine/threonine-protein kinase